MSASGRCKPDLLSSSATPGIASESAVSRSRSVAIFGNLHAPALHRVCSHHGDCDAARRLRRRSELPQTGTSGQRCRLRAGAIARGRLPPRRFMAGRRSISSTAAISPFEWWEGCSSHRRSMRWSSGHFGPIRRLRPRRRALVQAEELVYAQQGYFFPTVAANYNFQRTKIAGNFTVDDYSRHTGQWRRHRHLPELNRRAAHRRSTTTIIPRR